MSMFFLIMSCIKKDDDGYILSENGIIFNADLSYGSVLDIDSNSYRTIVIGSQTWMAENLKTTKYLNGDLIGTTIPLNLDISSESNPSYQWPAGNDENNVATFGRLYTWYCVVDNRKLCPSGWHVPTDVEWTTLTSYLGNNPIAGKLKEISTLHWMSPNTDATNSSGLTALPAGSRNGGIYDFDGGYGSWWSATEYSISSSAISYKLYYGDRFIYRSEESLKSTGSSVRCVKD